MQLSLLTTTVLGLTMAVAVQAKNTVSNRVFLIRHGEKPATGNGLSAQGVERSQCLPNVFTPNNGYNIGLILAEQPQSDGSQQRPYDTVEPLANSLNLTIDTQCQRDDTSCVTQQVEQFSTQSAGDVLICWEHHALKDISQALGDKFKYPGGSFDLIYEIVDGSLTSNSPWSENCPGLDS